MAQRRYNNAARVGYAVLDMRPIGENVKAAGITLVGGAATKVGDIWQSLAGISSNVEDIAATADQYSAIIKDLPTLYAQIRSDYAKLQAAVETTRNVAIATAVGLGTVGVFFLLKPVKGGA